MTLRSWSLLLILGVFAIILSAHAAHSQSLSVWDELSAQDALKQTAKWTPVKVVGMEARGDELIYKITTSSSVESLRLCSQLQTDVTGVVLREAYRTRATVELAITGPFNACVLGARVSKGS